jgi:hypothetical protein
MIGNGPKPESGFAIGREKIITGIGSPLGFFVLALLIVETFLGVAGALFGVSELVRIWLIAIGAILFLSVVVIVTFLVVKYPRNLVFTEHSHLQSMRYGYKDNPIGIEVLDRTPLIRQPDQSLLLEQSGLNPEDQK